MKSEEYDPLGIGAFVSEGELRREGLALRLESAREQLPELVGAAARVVVDNPGPIALAMCGSYVLTSAVINVVKPRSIFGMFACGVFSYALGTSITAEMVKRGMLRLRVRDAEGNLVDVGDA